MSSEEKSLRIIEFTGRPDQWRIWSRKFEARGNRKGYKNLLTGKIEIPTITQYEAALEKENPTPPDKKYIKLWELNELAYEDLLLSINGQTKSGKVAFNLVDNCVTDEQPDGNCKLAWERLVHKYAPKTAPSYIQLKKDFANSKLEVDSNPDEWITDLESLRSEMNKVKIAGKTGMSEVDLIIHILANLPEQYEVAVSSLEAKLKDSSNPLEIEEVREEINSRYGRIKKHAEVDLEEKALAAFKKQFKGTCNKCGGYGHKSGDPKCPESGNNSGGTSSGGGNRGPCYYCGKTGHIKADCKKRKADLKAKERGNMATGVADSDDESSVDESIDELGFNVCGVAGKRVCFKGEVSHIQCGEARDMHATVDTATFNAMKSAEAADTSKTMLGRSSMSDKVYQESGDALVSSDTADKCIKGDGLRHVSCGQARLKSILRKHTSFGNEKGMKCTIDGAVYPSFTKDTWYGDSGASCHIVNDDDDMFDVENINEVVGTAGGDIRATKKGKKRVVAKNSLPIF